jgi:hypothetical protein
MCGAVPAENQPLAQRHPDRNGEAEPRLVDGVAWTRRRRARGPDGRVGDWSLVAMVAVIRVSLDGTLMAGAPGPAGYPAIGTECCASRDGRHCGVSGLNLGRPEQGGIVVDLSRAGV